MLKVHCRRYIAGFGQIIGIHIDCRYVSDQYAGKIFIAYIGSDDLVALHHAVSAVDQLLKADDSLGIQFKISGNDQYVRGGEHHAACVGIVVNDGHDLGPVRTHINNSSHEAASRHHIHINHETVFVSFINHKGMKPVPGILGNNSRPYFLVFVILDIQIIELPKIGKLVPVLLKADIFHGKLINLRLQFFVLLQERADLHKLLGAPAKPASGFADPVLQGNDNKSSYCADGRTY